MKYISKCQFFLLVCFMSIGVYSQKKVTEKLTFINETSIIPASGLQANKPLKNTIDENTNSQINLSLIHI